MKRIRLLDFLSAVFNINLTQLCEEETFILTIHTTMYTSPRFLINIITFRPQYYLRGAAR